jgi:hypothetical protein
LRQAKLGEGGAARLAAVLAGESPADACDEINRRFDQVEVRLDRIEQKLDNHISDYTVHNIKQSNPE